MKILILEDEKTLADLYAKHLAGAGHVVRCSFSADEALEALWDFRPDLFVVDHGLKEPNIDGLELIRLAKKIWPELRVIVLTNFDHEELKAQACAYGVEEVLLKLNFSPKRLPLYLVEW